MLSRRPVPRAGPQERLRECFRLEKQGRLPRKPWHGTCSSSGHQSRRCLSGPRSAAATSSPAAGLSFAAAAWSHVRGNAIWVTVCVGLPGVLVGWATLVKPYNLLRHRLTPSRSPPPVNGTLTDLFSVPESGEKLHIPMARNNPFSSHSPHFSNADNQPSVKLPPRGLRHNDGVGRGVVQSSLAWRRYWYTVSRLIP
jgi:hypothetical protein